MRAPVLPCTSGWWRRSAVLLCTVGLLAACQGPMALHSPEPSPLDAATAPDPQRPPPVDLARLGMGADGPATAQPELDQAIEALMRSAQVPGLAVAVLRGGQLVYLRGYGVAAPAHEGRPAQPMRTDTVFRAASLTKAVFAWTVVQLAAEGQLDLDQPAAEVLRGPLNAGPGGAAWDDIADDARWQRLTLRQLLSHQSGLLNWRWINLNQRLDFKFSPGERYVYSGEGYQLAQHLVEARLGQALEPVIDERVNRALGLRDQRMRTSTEQAQAWGPRLAQPVADDGRVLPLRLSSRVRAAGSMATTPADYAAFLRHVLRREGLSPARHREMLSPQIAIDTPTQFPSHWPGQTDVNKPIGLGAGLGWVVYRGPYGRTFFKEGHDDGVSHLALGFADRGDGLLLMSNSNRAEALFWPVVEMLWPASCLPWFWMGHVPDDQAEWRRPDARATPRGPGTMCLQRLTAASRQPAAPSPDPAGAAPAEPARR